MNFVQQTAGLNAAGKQRSVAALPAGALYQGADFKIELIVYFLGHGFHFIQNHYVRQKFSNDSGDMKNQKKQFHIISQHDVQAQN